MASNQKEKEESSDIYTCYICRLQVPLESKRRHKGSYVHQAALKIASAALERLRAHVAPISESAKELVEPSQEKEHKNTSPVSFCGSCAAVFPSSEHAKHIRTKTHLMAALDDQVFEELVRGYVDEEEIQFLERISKDPCDDEERAVDESEAADSYTCNMCALDIPKAFKNEHELSSRHRVCLALANAASQRAIAFLTPTPIRVDTPTKTLENKMVALLKVYTGVDIKKQEHIETEEEIEVAKDKRREVKKRLTPKEYFTEIMPFIQYVGGFYTLIIDDTDYVTIKTGNGTYLRVHVGNFNGLYNIGGTEEYQMKCRMCDGYNMNVSYSSKGNIDKLHVMSLGHIKNVLAPINSVHGIRKINNTHSLCVLCNVFIPTYGVKDHIMRELEHTAFLAEALEKGKLFKESDNDMKFIIYTAPPVDMKADFFMKQSPPNFNSVLKPHYGLFGQGQGSGQNSQTSTGFGQTSPARAGFGQSTTFGQSTGQSATPFAVAQPASSQSFGKSGTFGDNQSTLYGTAQLASSQSSGKAPFGQNSGTGFGQITQPLNLNASEQPTSIQNFGKGGTFGLDTGFGQSTTFGQSPGTGFGQNRPDVNSSPQPSGLFFGNDPLGRNIVQTTLYGTSTTQSNEQTSSEKSDK